MNDLFGQPIFPPAAPVKEPEKHRRVGEEILQHFKRNRYVSFTAHQVSLAIGEQWPMDSVKNAIRRLIQGGHIVATGQERPGRDGERCHCYIYSTHKRSFK